MYRIFDYSPGFGLNGQGHGYTRALASKEEPSTFITI